MIHFVPAHLEKIRAKVPETAKEVDVVLGNLEDAIPADAKTAAREGFIEMANATDFAAMGVGVWTRINALNSPWHFDDVTRIVRGGGRSAGRDDGAQGRGTVGHPLHGPVSRRAGGAARAEEADPSPTPSWRPPRASPTSRRSAAPSPRMQGISLGPADLAASRARKTTPRRRRPSRLSGDRGSAHRWFAARLGAAGPLALHHRPHGRPPARCTG